MENRTREKAALAIFLVLVALGGLLLGAYFLTGRSWSVAATMVDDAAGSMDSYSVVAFSGVMPPAKEGAKASSASSSASSSSASSASAEADEPVPPEFTMRDAFGNSAGDIADTSLKESIQSIFEREDRRREAGDDTVYVSDVRDIYALKGADGLTLNLSDPDRYAQPSVMQAGDKRIGIFSISAYMSRAKLKATEELLREEGADVIACIAPRTSLLSTYDGLDVVVLTAPQAGRPDERDAGSTLVVESPEVGDVGVVLLSSNNVPSFKVVKEL